MHVNLDFRQNLIAPRRLSSSLLYSERALIKRGDFSHGSVVKRKKAKKEKEKKKKEAEESGGQKKGKKL